LITKSDRSQVIALVKQACEAGCRRSAACSLLGVSVRTLQRWNATGLVDKRQGSRAQPANALSQSERDRLLKVATSPEYQNMSPKKIIPALADAGLYLGSESTLYRILRQSNMLRNRSASKPPTKTRPKTLVAVAPNQVWSWDISYLPSTILGRFYYLYLVLDIFSRKIVGWQVHDVESAEHASALIKQTCLDENLVNGPAALHSDNGAPMRGSSLLAMLQQLNILASFSRPGVSNDNPYSESLFRTVKYCPQYPEYPFDSIQVRPLV